VFELYPEALPEAREAIAGIAEFLRGHFDAGPGSNPGP
jgi:hypothetical protein